MNAKCFRCNKTVYPVEKLNCLDKIWHKGCFNCEVCHMTLTMKTYKGYDKKPYCNTHYPTTKFTAVADTPENLRLKKNTTNQSNVVYHKEFEREKGKFTAVADDPETLRIKKAQMQSSQIAYTQDFEKERGKVTSVADDPETMRTRKIQQQASDVAYQQRDLQPVPAPQLAPNTRYAPEAAPIPSQPPPASPPSGPRYVAIYDYTAGDDDEVSFSEGDIIVNAEIIDDGWMTGTVKKTGQHGMLPSNYVEAQ